MRDVELALSKGCVPKWAFWPFGDAHLDRQAKRNPSSHGRLLEPFLAPLGDSYLVDPASSHMLVSKIKPCMSKYKQLYREAANGSLNQL